LDDVIKQIKRDIEGKKDINKIASDIIDDNNFHGDKPEIAKSRNYIMDKVGAKYVNEASADEEDEKERLVLTQKKLFDSIYNMKPKERKQLLVEILELADDKDGAKEAAKTLASKPEKYKKAIQLLMPSVHKAVYEEDDGVKFPMVVDFDDKDEIIVHDMLQALKDGKKLKAIKINKEFEDDHLPCVNVTATVGNKRYKFSDWWLERKILKKYHQAEGGDRGALQGVKNWLIRVNNDIIRQHKEQMKAAKAAKAIEEAAAAKEQATAQMLSLIQKLNDLSGSDDDKKKNKKEIKATEKEIRKLAKEHDLKLDEAIFDLGTKMPIEEAARSLGFIKKGAKVIWHDPDNDLGTGEYTIVDCPDEIEDDSIILISNGQSESEVLPHELIELDDANEAHHIDRAYVEKELANYNNHESKDIETLANNIAFHLHITDDKKLEDLAQHLEDSSDEEGYISTNMTEIGDILGLYVKEQVNEASDDEYFEIESRLRDVCFQYYQQLLTKDEAATQIQEIIKDSETMQDVLKDVTPDAMVDAIINHFGWTESMLAESTDEEKKQIELRLKNWKELKSPDEFGIDTKDGAKQYLTDSPTCFLDIIIKDQGIKAANPYTDYNDALEDVLDLVIDPLENSDPEMIGQILLHTYLSFDTAREKWAKKEYKMMGKINESSESSTLEADLKKIATEDIMEKGIEQAGFDMRQLILSAQDDYKLCKLADRIPNNEKLFSAVIEYYGWDDMMNESVDPVADEVDAKLKSICSQYYADLLPNTEAIEQAKQILDACAPEKYEALLAACNCADEELVYNIVQHYGWNAFELADSVKGEE